MFIVYARRALNPLASVLVVPPTSAHSSPFATASLPRQGAGAWLGGWIAGCAPGVLLAAFIALAATTLGSLPALQSRGLGALTLAILFGMAAGALLPARLDARAAPGLDATRQKLLRLGIILYGLRLTFQDIAAVGAAGLVLDALVVASTFGLACWAGLRLFKLERGTAMLIGAGSAICGAAAVLATQPVVKGRADQVAVAIATVVTFGTLSMFLYPVAYAWLQQAWPGLLDARSYGLLAGATIHEVAQVVVAGSAAGPQAADSAVIVKMVRVMMLAPFLILLSAWLARKDAPETDSGTGTARKVTVPWFAVAFVAMAGVNSLGVMPEPLCAAGAALGMFVLAMAMAALGACTRLGAIRRAGAKPLALAAGLLVWLVAGGALMGVAVHALLG
ncbi:Putative membrane protein YeiH [plant metagenome]|uniref:Membrane protein YeiH n=1 Tax=plant metagenome TaxID=1297885 RepID=A0A484X968_9ZZZZ